MSEWRLRVRGWRVRLHTLLQMFDLEKLAKARVSYSKMLKDLADLKKMMIWV